MGRILLVSAGLVLGAGLLWAAFGGGGTGGDAAQPSAPERGDDGREAADLVDPGSLPIEEEAAATRIPVPEEAPEEAAVEEEPALASLHVRVIDRATGAPLACEVELWQLGLPEDDTWTAGDRKHATAEVPEEGFTFDDVPPGQYRCYVKGRSLRSAEDPPEFVVGLPANRIELPIDRPGIARVLVRLVDQEGRPIEQADFTSSYFRPRVPWRAPFADPRWNKVAGDSVIGMGGSFGGRHGSRHIEGPGGVYDMGLFVEQTHDSDKPSRSYRFSTEGRSAYVRVNDLRPVTKERGKVEPTLPDVVYFAVCPERGPFEEAIRVAGGGTAAEAGIFLRIDGEGVPYDPSDPRPWLHAPIEVSAWHPGYENLHFEHRLIDGPPLPRLMEPVSEDP